MLRKPQLLVVALFCSAALLALFFPVENSTALASCGCAISLWLVINAQLYRRYFPDVQLRFTR